MAKLFSIIKKQNVLDNTDAIYGYSPIDDEKKLLAKLERQTSESEKELYRYYIDKKMVMHILPNISDELVKELSRRCFHTVYGVCRKKNKKEEILYISMFKDSSQKYLMRIPSATIKINKKEYVNPSYYVKELRLVI